MPVPVGACPSVPEEPAPSLPRDHNRLIIKTVTSSPETIRKPRILLFSRGVLIGREGDRERERGGKQKLKLIHHRQDGPSPASISAKRSVPSLLYILLVAEDNGAEFNSNDLYSILPRGL